LAFTSAALAAAPATKVFGTAACPAWVIPDASENAIPKEITNGLNVNFMIEILSSCVI
jgi:hypothetical protein